MRRMLSVLCCTMLLMTSCISLRDAQTPVCETTLRETDTNIETDAPKLVETEKIAEKEVDEPPLDFPPVEPEPEDPYADVDISFLGIGDVLVHPNIYMDAGYRGYEGKEYDFLPMFSDVAGYIADADITFVNQETVMAGAAYGYSGYPCFNAPQQLGIDLCTLGFDIVNIANNHMLDMGTTGLADTMSFWKSQPTLMVGAYDDEADAANIRILTRDNINIAVLSYTYGTNGIVKDASSPIVIPYIDDARITSDLAAAREAADFVLVSMHWGVENTYTPSEEQRRLAKLLADGGADAIIGHHSHCLQPIEWIDTDRGRTICVYSLGNFVSGMAAPMNHVGGMFTFRITGDGAGGLCVTDPILIPTVFYFGMDYFNTHVYLLEDYTDSIAASHGVGIDGYTLTPAKAREIVTDVIDGEFLRLQ